MSEFELKLHFEGLLALDNQEDEIYQAKNLMLTKRLNKIISINKLIPSEVKSNIITHRLQEIYDNKEDYDKCNHKKTFGKTDPISFDKSHSKCYSKSD